MHVSQKNRVRLVAAAAGIGILMNPGQAGADPDLDSTGSGDTSTSQSSDPGGGEVDTPPADPDPPAPAPPDTTEAPADTTATPPAEPAPSDTPPHSETPPQSDPPSTTSAPEPTTPQIDVTPESAGPTMLLDDDDAPATAPPATTRTPIEPLTALDRPGRTAVPSIFDLSVPPATGGGAVPAVAPTAIAAPADEAPAPNRPATLGFAGLLALVGLPLLTGTSGATTAAAPAPWTLLWFSRRLQGQFFNTSPTASYQLSQTDTGHTVALTTADADGDPVTHTVTRGPEHGTVVKNPDGTYSYTRAPGSTGADRFTVTVSDASAGSHQHGVDSLRSLLTGQNPHTRAVVIDIPAVSAPANNAPQFAAPTDQQTHPTSGAMTGRVNATDPDAGDTLRYTSDWNGTAGTFVLDPATGVYTFTPTDEAMHAAAGNDATAAQQSVTVDVTVTDGSGATDTDQLVLSLLPRNTAPTLSGTDPIGVVQTAPGSTSGTTTGDLSTHVTDADADDVTFTLDPEHGPAHGSVVVNADGTFTYTPDPTGGAATDSFTVVLDDGHANGTSSQVVTVHRAQVMLGAVDAETGEVSGQLLGHQAGTTYSVDGGTATGAPNTFLTPNGATVVFDDSNGTFTYAPDPADRFWAGGGGPSTEQFTVVAQQGGNPPQHTVVTTPITATDTVTLDATGLDAVSPRYSAGVSTDGTALTVLDRTTAQTATIALPAGHTGSTVSFSTDDAYAHVTNPDGTLITVVDLADSSVVGSYAIADNGDGTETLTWTGAPSGILLMAFDPSSAALTGTDIAVTPDGTYALIAVTDTDGTTLHSGNTATGTHTQLSVTPLTGPVEVYVLGSGRVLATNGDTVQFLSLADAEILATSTPAYDVATEYEYSADGRYAYGYTEGFADPSTLTIVDLQTGAVDVVEIDPNWTTDPTGTSVYWAASTVTGGPGEGGVFPATTTVTRLSFADPQAPTSWTVDGYSDQDLRGGAGRYSFDENGNFLIATTDPVFDGEGVTFTNSKLTRVNPVSGPISGPSIPAPDGVIVYVSAASDGTPYVTSGTQSQEIALYALTDDGPVFIAANSLGVMTDDRAHMFIITPDPDDPSIFTVRVRDLNTGEMSTPFTVTADELASGDMSASEYVVFLSEGDGGSTVVEVLLQSGQRTMLTTTDDTVSAVGYLTDGLFYVITTDDFAREHVTITRVPSMVV
ncbi:Ig-like domain-containing protein [Gordonia phosphorivorans]|uniref:Ig-like domain-containing protein n=1 Tax=Gordonia phosphorivorans TaxID=1056982 RepID=A0ABV6H511_9ACTN